LIVTVVVSDDEFVAVCFAGTAAGRIAGVFGVLAGGILVARLVFLAPTSVSLYGFGSGGLSSFGGFLKGSIAICVKACNARMKSRNERGLYATLPRLTNIAPNNL
jgi:hypothetical protein